MSPELVPFHCSLSTVSFGLLPTLFLFSFSFMVNTAGSQPAFSHICSAAPQLKTLSQCLTVFGLSPSPWTHSVWLGLVTCPDPSASPATPPSNTSPLVCTCCPGPLLAPGPDNYAFLSRLTSPGSPLWTPIMSGTSHHGPALYHNAGSLPVTDCGSPGNWEPSRGGQRSVSSSA